MRFAIVCLASVLLVCVSTPAAADTTRDRAIKRCQENRGTDCSSEQGLRPWIEEEKPMTEEQRRAAAAANARRAEQERRHNERRAIAVQQAKEQAEAEKRSQVPRPANKPK